MSYAYGAADDFRGACHDMRQPIAGVCALAGAALAEAGTPEGVRSRLSQIISLAEWQSDMMEYWIEASGPGRPDPSHADVLGTVSDAVTAERLTWSGELILEWPPEPLFTPVHPVLLRRMTVDVLANATQAAGPAGTVLVRMHPRGARLLVVVEDDGPGFGPMAGKPRIGLSAVAQCAFRYGGRLECGSSMLGGVRVTLSLPLTCLTEAEEGADEGCSV